jgi:hypothetical protein
MIQNTIYGSDTLSANNQKYFLIFKLICGAKFDIRKDLFQFD